MPARNAEFCTVRNDKYIYKVLQIVAYKCANMATMRKAAVLQHNFIEM